jgi:hypothetical protein
MSDSVAFIFKTLIKVPVIIFVSFFILNIFAFSFIYFKLLGISYVVMQTAVENNYLPASEAATLCNYVDTLNTAEMVENAAVVVYYDSSTGQVGTMNSSNTTTAVWGNADARKRRQYGREVTVGVTADYVFVWPIDYRHTTTNDTGVAGMDDSVNTTFRSDAELQQIRETETTSRNNILITYTVPGLKYYPDMLTH